MADDDLEVCYRHPNETTRVHCTRCDRPICPDCMTPAPVGHHCPDCVAEGAKDMRKRRMTLRRARNAAMVLLGINVAVFVLQLVLGGPSGTGRLVEMGAMVPPLIVEGQYWRLVTAMFLHIGPLHLAFNMFGLHIFGGLVEGTFGTVRFLGVYFSSGVFASAVSFALGSPNRIAAGASGAIFGLLGAWLAYNVRRRSLASAQANIQGALLLVGVNLLLGFSVRGIDNLAHLGGLVGGVVAGLAAEGFGSRRVRVLTQVGGMVLLVLAAAALVTWRVADLRGPLT